MKPPQESHVVIIGAARNVERTVERQVRVFERAFAPFRKTSCLIVESDSTDQTLRKLARLKQTTPDFNFLSLGKLAAELPLRTQRIARARNAALDFCSQSPELAGADYVAVADWDGVNLHLTAPAVLSCWKHDQWEVVTANQLEEYYDVWALRHPIWCPGDCWEDCHRLEREFDNAVAHQLAVSSKRVKIPVTHGPINVDSAFGGLAIYESRWIFQSRYQLASGEREVCEHVALHAAMRARGARIIINPALVNTHSHHDSRPLFSWERLLHIARRRLR